MKTRLTLKLNPELIQRLKTEAAAKAKSVSDLAEEYLEKALPTKVVIRYAEPALLRRSK